MIFQYNEVPEFKAANLYKKYYHDAGWDIRAATDVLLPPGMPQVVSTGLHICVPKGLKGIIQSRSGGSINRTVEAGNAGVIDYGYTGECRIKLYNFSNEIVCYEKGDRIAQIVFDLSHTVSGWDFIKLYWQLFRQGLPQEVPEVPLSEWPATDRGDGGFSSTGIK